MSGILLITLCFFQHPVVARDTAVNAQVSVTVQNEPVKSVLSRLEEQTGYTFFYLHRQVDIDRKVTLKLQNVTLERALQELFANTATTYEITGRQVVLKKARAASQKASTDPGAAGLPAADDLLTNKGSMVLPLTAWTYEQQVQGRVTGAAGEGLPGVNVIIQGTTSGTTTDIDGNYRISVPDENAILVFSFIGYESKSVQVGGQSIINVTLLADVTTLEDVVIVGYGTTSKRGLTGAVTSVKSSDLTSLKVPSVDAMLQGQGSGIQVSQGAGVPGGPVRVMVRGTNSLSAGTEPLWVIDGIPVDNPASGIGGSGRNAIPQNPLASINPNDIESIEVLKDASATAIYGSRGSSGVILVTTKSGRGSAGTLSFEATYGISELTKDPQDMGFANAEEWLAIVDQARSNAGIETSIEDNLGSLTAVDVGPDGLLPEQMEDNFWFDRLLRTGRFQEYNLSASKGFDEGSIYFSGNYRKDEGVLNNNDFERLSFRVNAEYEAVRNLTMGIRLNLSHTKNLRPLNGGAPSGNDGVAAGGFGEAAGGALPIFPAFNSEGEYWNPTSGMNLAATTDRALFKDQLLLYRALGGLYFDYKIQAIEGLSLRSEWSADITSSNRLFWASDVLRPAGLNYAENATSLGVNLNYNLFARFQRTFNDVHRVNVVAGTESQELSSRGSNLFGEGIPGRNQDFGSPTAPISRAPSAGLGGERYFRSYFGRFEYAFKDKYLLGGSFRRDGVSIFRPDQRWGNFSALSAGWIFTEEDFMANTGPLTFGKLRASFGQTGNQSIYELATYTTTTTWPRYGSTDGAQLVNNLGSEDLTWETTNAYDAGVELGFFNDRITLAAGYYLQDVKDLLFRVPVAISVGLFEGSNIWANVADMRNEGWEFTLNTVNVETGGFRWSTSINFTTNKNKVLGITEELDSRGQGVSVGLTRNITGKPLSTFFVAEYAGISETTGVPMIYEIDRQRFADTGETVKTGNVIPATNANLPNHRILQEDKTGLPTFFGGFTNTFNYKGFELSAMFVFQGGNYLYNSAEITNTTIGQGGNNLYRDLLTDSWTPENTDARYPKLTWNNSYNINNDGNPNFNANGTPNNNVNYANGGLDRASDRYVYKGDFLRLRTIQLSYVFDGDVLERLGLRSLRAFVNGNNLLTFTKFPGWDPEQLNYSGDNQSRNLGQGIVNNTLPPVKTYSVGLNVTF